MNEVLGVKITWENPKAGLSLFSLDSDQIKEAMENEYPGIKFNVEEVEWQIKKGLIVGKEGNG